MTEKINLKHNDNKENKRIRIKAMDLLIFKLEICNFLKWMWSSNIEKKPLINLMTVLTTR